MHMKSIIITLVLAASALAVNAVSPEFDAYLFAYFEGGGEGHLQEHLRFGVSDGGLNWEAPNNITSEEKAVLLDRWGEKTTDRISYDDKEWGAYLMVFFSDATHDLFMATSPDGYTFTAINDGKPIISGDSIAEQRGIRDPHISRGPDGAFYLAMTDLHIFAKDEGLRDTQWERPSEKYGWGNNRGLVLMKSYDLINWTRSNLRMDKLFPDKFGNIGCAWAPETTYDPKEGKMLIYFTMRIGNGKSKLYYAYTDDDFTKLVTEPEILFEYPNPEIQVLDADITPMPDGRWCMAYAAQDGTSGIKIATSDNISGPWQYRDEWVDFEPKACEAPNVWKRIGENKWVVMYDIFGISPHNFGFAETSDFKSFTNLGRFNEGVMKAINFQSPKHGAIIPITIQEKNRLEKYWESNKCLINN